MWLIGLEVTDTERRATFSDVLNNLSCLHIVHHVLQPKRPTDTINTGVVHNIIASVYIGAGHNMCKFFNCFVNEYTDRNMQYKSM